MATFTFGSYVTAGEQAKGEHHEQGFTITARIVYDEDATPENRADEGVYSPEALDAWDHDRWWYGGVVLTVSYGGVVLDEYAAALWGIEVNFPGAEGGNAYLGEAADELVPEAMERGRKARADMLRKLLPVPDATDPEAWYYVRQLGRLRVPVTPDQGYHTLRITGPEQGEQTNHMIVRTASAEAIAAWLVCNYIAPAADDDKGVSA